MYKKLLRFLKNPKPYLDARELLFLQYRSELFSKCCRYSFMDDKHFLEYRFFTKIGYRLSLKTPRTFNEKLQWIKLYYRNPLYTNLADKYLVRSYVKDMIGEDYLVELLGVYEDPSEINWHTLPDSFVIKTTHSSGWNILCKDKSLLDPHEVTSTLRNWINTNYYESGGSREWQYKNIHPRIIIEKYLEGDKRFGLLDYKFYCYWGNPLYVQVISGRFSKKITNMYELDWSLSNIQRPNYDARINLPKPEKLDDMLAVSKELSKGIPFCRIDLYCFDNIIYFSEITFCPAGGFDKFNSYESDRILGEPLILPNIMKALSISSQDFYLVGD